MSLGQIAVYLAIALLCGLGGQLVAGRSVGGYVVSTAVGLVGALVGEYIARSLQAPEPFAVSVGGRTIPILWAIIGATLVTLVVAFFQRGRTSSRRRGSLEDSSE